jgi:hypothetical protein
MQPLDKETRLEELENRVQYHLGRELTPREKFYLAMAEACAPAKPATKESANRRRSRSKRSHARSS